MDIYLKIKNLFDLIYSFLDIELEGKMTIFDSNQTDICYLKILDNFDIMQV